MGLDDDVSVQMMLAGFCSDDGGGLGCWWIQVG